MKQWLTAVAVLALGASLAMGQTSSSTGAKKAPAHPTTAKPAPASTSTHTATHASTSASSGQGRMDGVAAVVAGEPIFDSEVDEQVYLFFMQQGMQPDSTQALAMRKSILDRLIDEKLIVQEAKRKQVVVPDSEVDHQVSDAIADAKQRLGGDAGYQAELSKEGISENDLKERYRGEIRRQLLANQLLRKELNLKLEVSPAEAEAYFKANPGDFPKRPEEVGLAVIQIPIAPESSAVVAAKARAQGLLDRVRKGESFTRVAMEASEDPGTRASGGDLGFFGRGDLDSTFEQVAFHLKPGQISDLVRTPFGYHIIRVEEVDTTRNQIHARHILVRVAPQQADQKRAEALANQVYDQAQKGADFGDLVRRYSKYQGPAGPGGNLGFLPLSAFPAEFRQTLEKMPIGSVSRPLAGPQGYNIFKMLDRHPERSYTLDEVKEQLPDLVRQMKLKKQYDTWVAGLRTRTQIQYK
ncbi:MAG TPA: peptidylprolyl isomerase [Candidatus Eisenbacteria bacterium]|jgi:peptidyl-prolyl cis-trans isomerase SurA|nr:peptidylprolyl isomerase [Candidatus Eisenbacteria bacterium]